MSNSPKVSVIIPIYNVSAFLDQALESVKNQTYKNLEIICINDGSTDNSLDIIKKHAEGDERFVIIDKQNEGYGASCNKGLGIATGEWISILEPDDWLGEQMFEDMLSFASKYPSAQIVKTPYFCVSSEDGVEKIIPSNFKYIMNPKKQPFKLKDELELIMHHPSIWSAIYRRDFLEDKGIKFMPIPGAGWSDNPFLIETMCQADAIVYLNNPYYYYRVDTQEKLRNFHRNNYQIPFARWNEMMDIIERLNIDDPKIIEAHYVRAFVYIGGVLEYNDKGNAEIDALVKNTFERMDKDIVLNSDFVSPGMKNYFGKVRNVPVKNVGRAKYISRLVSKSIKSTKHSGLKNTVPQVIRYLKTHRKRTGR